MAVNPLPTGRRDTQAGESSFVVSYATLAGEFRFMVSYATLVAPHATPPPADTRLQRQSFSGTDGYKRRQPGHRHALGHIVDIKPKRVLPSDQHFIRSLVWWLQGLRRVDFEVLGSVSRRRVTGWRG